MLTGLPRQDVARILVVADEELAIFGERHSRIARVLSGCRDGAREPLFQRGIAYGDIPQDAVLKLRADVAADAEQFLVKHDAAVSRQDRDVTPMVRGTGRKRVVVGVWYYDHDYDEDADTEPGDAEE